MRVAPVVILAARMFALCSAASTRVDMAVESSEIRLKVSEAESHALKKITETRVCWTARELEDAHAVQTGQLEESLAEQARQFEEERAWQARRIDAAYAAQAQALATASTEAEKRREAEMALSRAEIERADTQAAHGQIEAEAEALRRSL